MAFACMVDGKTFASKGGEEILETGNNFADGSDVVSLILEISFRRTDWDFLSIRCRWILLRNGVVAEKVAQDLISFRNS